MRSEGSCAFYVGLRRFALILPSVLMLSSLVVALGKRMARNRLRTGTRRTLLLPQGVERIRVNQNHPAPARELRKVQVGVELARGSEAANLFNIVADKRIILSADPQKEVHDRLLRARVHDHILG